MGMRMRCFWSRGDTLTDCSGDQRRLPREGTFGQGLKDQEQFAKIIGHFICSLLVSHLVFQIHDSANRDLEYANVHFWKSLWLLSSFSD